MGRKGEGDIGHLHAIYFFQKQQKQHIYCSRAEHAFRDIKAYLANFLVCIFCFVGKTNVGDRSAYCRLFLQFVNSWHPSVYPTAAPELSAKRAMSALANFSIALFLLCSEVLLSLGFARVMNIHLTDNYHHPQTAPLKPNFSHHQSFLALFWQREAYGSSCFTNAPAPGYQMGSDDHDED